MERIIEIAKITMLNSIRKRFGNQYVEKFNQEFEKIPFEYGDDIDKYLESIGANGVTNKYMGRGPETVLFKQYKEGDDLLYTIDTIIHECAHYFSKTVSTNKIGNLKLNTIFEEAMATIFSEICINDLLLDYKNLNIPNIETIVQPHLENGYISEVYSDETNFLNSIFIAMTDDNECYSAIAEYILGDKKNFTKICSNNLGIELEPIIKKMEEEIKWLHNIPSGEGFTNRENIKYVIKTIGDDLLNILVKNNIYFGVVKPNEDMKVFSNRCWKNNNWPISSCIKIKMIQDNEFFRKYWDDFDKSVGISIENLNKTILSESEILNLSLTAKNSQMVTESIKEKNIKLLEKKLSSFRKTVKFTRKTSSAIINKIASIENLILELESKIFELEIGYTISDLINFGITIEEIEELKAKFDKVTEMPLNRRERVTNKIVEKQFELEIGYTISDLINFGITIEEIEELKAQFDKVTGMPLNRKEKVQQILIEKNINLENNEISDILEEKHKFSR